MVWPVREKYVSSLAGGGGDGSESLPWTIAEAKNQCLAGDRINVKADGNYISTLTWSSNGTDLQPIHVRGYGTTIGDKTRAVSVAAMTFTGAHYIVECLSASQAAAAHTINFSSEHGLIHDCDVECTGATGTALRVRYGAVAANVQIKATENQVASIEPLENYSTAIACSLSGGDYSTLIVVSSTGDSVAMIGCIARQVVDNGSSIGIFVLSHAVTAGSFLVYGNTVWNTKDGLYMSAVAGSTVAVVQAFVNNISYNMANIGVRQLGAVTTGVTYSNLAVGGTTGARYAGTGDTPIHNDIVLSSDPFIDAASDNFLPNDNPDGGALIQNGALQAPTTRPTYRDVGALQTGGLDIGARQGAALAITPTSYTDLKIFQRNSASARRGLVVTGTLLAGSIGLILDYRIVPHNDTGAAYDWLSPSHQETRTSGVFSMTISIPVSDTWKNLQIRVRTQDGTVVETYAPTSSQLRIAAGGLFSLAGQSNTVRLNTVTGATVPDDATSQFSVSAWAVNAGEGCVNLANQLRTNLGMAIGIINSGAGLDATALTPRSDYLAAGSWNNYGTRGTIPYALWKIVNDLATTGDRGLEGVVWFQGEAESTGATIGIYTTARSHEMWLTQMVREFMRQDYAHWATADGSESPVPFHIIGLMEHGSTVLGTYMAYPKCTYASVNDALRNFAEKDAYATYTQAYDATLSDGLHMDAAGGTLLGLRLAGAITRFINPAHSSSGMGPKITGVTWVDNTTIDLTVTHDKGTDITVPANAHLCFQLLNAQDMVHISAAAKVDATTIRLTLAREIRGPTSVLKYATAGHVEPAWIITDNDSPVMPLQATFYRHEGRYGTLMGNPGLDGLLEVWTDTYDVAMDQVGTTTTAVMTTGGSFDEVVPGARITAMRAGAVLVNGVVTLVEINDGGVDRLTFEPAAASAVTTADDVRVQAGVVTSGGEGRHGGGCMVISNQAPREATYNG